MNNVLLWSLIILIILNLNCLLKDVKSNFTNISNKDINACFARGLNCALGRTGCECPAGPASGLKGSLPLAESV